MITLQQVDATVQRDAQMIGLLDPFDQHLGAAVMQRETSGRKKRSAAAWRQNCANQAPSILTMSGLTRAIRSAVECPVPKSSMAMRMPSRRTLGPG
jgi:hypothetical protein